MAGLSLARRLAAKGQGERGRRLARESVPYVIRWYDEQDEDVRTDMLDAVEDLTILAIQEGDNELLRGGLLTLSVLLTKQLTTGNKELHELIPPNVRMAAMFGYAHLSAELDQDDGRHTVIRAALSKFKHPVATLDFWLSMSRDTWLAGNSQLIFRYHDVWGHFRERIEALPRTYESGHSPFDYNERAEHKSELVRKLSREIRMSMWNVDDLLESLKDWYGDAGGTATSA